MLIRLFKPNSTLSYIFLSALAVLLWINGSMTAEPIMSLGHMPLYELFILPLSAIPFLWGLLSLSLVVGEAFILNHIALQSELISKPSFLTALMYVIFMAAHNSMFTLHPALIANLFLLLSISALSNSYRKVSASSNSFDSGALFAIATLFYAPSIIMLPVWALGFFMLRAFNWREWVVFFIGIVVPYLFIFTYYFWVDDLNILFAEQLFSNITDHAPLQYFSAFYVIVALAIVLLVLAIKSFISHFQGASQKKIINTYIFASFGVFSLLSLAKAPTIYYSYYSLFIIPLSIFTAEYFLVEKNLKWVNFIFYLVFVSIVVNIVSSFI